MRQLSRTPLIMLVATMLAFAPAARAAISLAPVTTATAPMYLTHAGDQRLFIVEQAGRILIFDRQSGVLRGTPFLDIRHKVSLGGERGLLSMAFHPDYVSNGLFYVNYTSLNGDTVVERYKASANPDLADPASAARLLLIAQPFSNHNGGQLQIGPRDGHLYVGMGDGGSSGDPGCRAQRTDTLLGKMLRLNVRQNLNTAPYYGIPADNPFTTAGDPGNAIADEIWALGLRNPWRFSFDRSSGDLFIADVGQNAWEEVHHRPHGSPGGANFGWKVMEGLHCFSSAGCPGGTPACNSPALIPPIHEYGHSNGGCSITGGYFYRGSRASELTGRYLFGDYCSGTVRTLRLMGSSWQSATLLEAGSGLASFGEDSDGELYLIRGNQILKVVSDTPAVPALGSAGLGLLSLLTLLVSGAAARRGGSRRPPPPPVDQR